MTNIVPPTAAGNPFLDTKTTSVAADRGRDFALAAERLAAWFGGKIGAPVRVANLRYPVGAGRSNETILCDVSYEAGSGSVTKSYVIRLHPGEYQAFLDPAFERQYRLLALIGSSFRGVRVPEMCWQEHDKTILGEPFFVMSRIIGRVPVSSPCYNVAGFLADATPKQREHAWTSAMQQFAAIHRIPATAVDFLHRPEYGPTGFTDEFEYWQRSLTRAAADSMPPVTAAASEWLKRNMPTAPPPGISWGDARIGNMIFDDDFNVAAVLDWEQASLAGCIQDLGWWLALDQFMSTEIGVKRLEGLGTREQTIGLWQELTGLPTDDLQWFEAYAAFKCAILAMRMMRMDRKFTPGNTPGNSSPTRWLARFLDLPPPADME
jgi:aminoglycoside phosphotransferase (APT) family kinase protein